MFTHKARAGHRLVLVEIENLMGGVVKTTEQLRRVQSALYRAIDHRPADQIVLACGRLSADVVGFDWNGPHRLILRSGPQGPGLGLLEILESERIDERFPEVVVASGDGMFSNVVSRLAASSGVDVMIVARTGACSPSLRMAAARTVDLDLERNPKLEIA